MPQALLASDHTALLVIDLQLGMFDGVRIAPIHAGEVLLTRVHTLLSKAHQAGTRVIHVRHSARPGRPLDPTTKQWEIHPAIAPLPTETIVDKRTPDAFLDTTLLETLTTSGTKRLVVVGAQTELCVDTTCRRAYALGFEVVLVADGHSTWDNDVLSAEQIIHHTNQTLAEWFVRLESAADLSVLPPAAHVGRSLTVASKTAPPRIAIPSDHDGVQPQPNSKDVE